MRQEQKKLRLRSLPESINQLEGLIEEICDDYNLNHNYLGCITVSLTEAFNNALQHGNKNNPEKFILIDFQKTSTGLYFKIKDHRQMAFAALIGELPEEHHGLFHG